MPNLYFQKHYLRKKMHMNKVREIPIEEFFRNSEKSSFDISPDGKHISYMAPYKSRMNIFVSGIDLAEPHQVTFEEERDVAGYMWANNNRILFMKDDGGDENFQLYGVDADGSDMRPYTKMKGVRTHILDDLEEIDDEILIETNQRNPEIFDPYRLNLITGEMTMLAENPGNIQAWMTDHDGKLRIAYSIVDGVNQEMLYRDTEDEEFRPVIRTSFREDVSAIVFTADNKNVYAITNLSRDKSALVLMNPATAEELEEIFTNDRYDISGVGWSNLRKKLTAVSYAGHKDTVRHFFDAESERINTRLTAAFPNHKFGTAATNKAEDMRIIYVGNDRTRGAYYLYDVKADKLSKIADLSPWLKEEELSSMIPVVYTSRDGLQIEAYLTLPNGYSLETAKGLPTVVIPHGGPWARDYWGYDSEVQFLANRGYAVFQMNFRGSTGYGRKFKELSYKQWGQTMQDDITDGVMWLIDNGYSDPKRIAIYGGSYGGYATLQALVKTPELFACGVDYVGVSNLFSFMNTIPPYWKPMLEMMYEQVGNPETDKEILAANSPALNADKIVRPLFIAQGANDPRVNKAESDQMVEALRKRGVEVDYMVKDNEGHGFHNEENRFELYHAMEEFLKKYMKQGKQGLV